MTHDPEPEPDPRAFLRRQGMTRDPEPPIPKFLRRQRNGSESATHKDADLARRHGKTGIVLLLVAVAIAALVFAWLGH